MAVGSIPQKAMRDFMQGLAFCFQRADGVARNKLDRCLRLVCFKILRLLLPHDDRVHRAAEGTV